MGIERIVGNAMLLLALTTGCVDSKEEQEKQAAAIVEYATSTGIPVEVISYQRPDETILQVWNDLKRVNHGQSYEINVTEGHNQFHLCFDGEGFRYNSITQADEGRRVHLANQSGGLYGNPYQPEEAVLARNLRENTAVRTTLLTAYEHKRKMIPNNNSCSF